MTLTLVLGGARSGKSRYAQTRAAEWARARGGRPVYIATGEAGDGEMAQRIARHQADRGEAWTTIEAPLDLDEALARLGPDDVAVIDCLTLWLSNAMAAGDHERRVQALPATFAGASARLFVVGNEVGWGVVPDNPLARAFRDAAGQLHQCIAETADEVVLVAAGLPLFLKGPALSDAG